MENPVTFDTLGLSQDILRGVLELNFAAPTPIQAQAIPILLEGTDVIGRSNTGTGKTAAFGIPAAEKIEAGGHAQVLILSPTRELAMQISQELRKFSKYKPAVRTCLVCGGQSMTLQLNQLPHSNLIVGTPGRVLDHLQRGTLKLENLKLLVLDEADEMLNMGFYEDIRTILEAAPEERQTVLFSATMPPPILKLTNTFMRSPKLIAVSPETRTVDNIEQAYVQVAQPRKFDALNLLLQHHNPTRALVFCNTKVMVDELVEQLNDHGFAAIGLHGDMRQAVRTQVMHNYKRGRIRILVATDVAARGIDVEDIQAVYNYDLPAENEYYIHRIGRTGRAGRSGFAHSLVCNRTQTMRIRALAQFLRAPIREIKLPTREDILATQREGVLTELRARLEGDEALVWKDAVEKLVSDGYDPISLAAALLEKVTLPALQALPETDVPPVDFLPPRQANAPMARPAGATPGWVPLRVSIGRNARITPPGLVAAVSEATGLPARAVGKISIFSDYSILEFSPQNARIVLEKASKISIRGQRVHFGPSTQSHGDRPAFRPRTSNYPPRRDKPRA